MLSVWSYNYKLETDRQSYYKIFSNLQKLIGKVRDGEGFSSVHSVIYQSTDKPNMVNTVIPTVTTKDLYRRYIIEP